jgi:acetyl-CoA carboxylase biotin carboxyl carrier protein
MNLDDVRSILDLVREHELAEFEFERDGLKLRIRKLGPAMSVSAPVAAAPPTAVPASAPAAVPPAGDLAPLAPGAIGVDLAVIQSPIVGTFYRSAEPDARPFADVGDTVRKGQVLCIIEAMKLMNEIESDCDGEVTAVYVENGQPVQFGDRLFAIKVR